MAQKQGQGCRLVQRSLRCVGLLFLVVADVVVELLGEAERLVDVAGVGIFRIGDDGELLLGLPLENEVEAGRVVVSDLNLTEHLCGLLFGEVWVPGEFGEDLFVGEEVAGDHGEDQAAVVADVGSCVECVEQVRHHSVLA